MKDGSRLTEAELRMLQVSVYLGGIKQEIQKERENVSLSSIETAVENAFQTLLDFFEEEGERRE